jgi:hypothetical protein
MLRSSRGGSAGEGRSRNFFPRTVWWGPTVTQPQPHKNSLQLPFNPGVAPTCPVLRDQWCHLSGMSTEVFVKLLVDQTFSGTCTFLLKLTSFFFLFKNKIWIWNESTVKASNFGPHGNFGGLFLASSVASVDESCTENEQNRICRSKVSLQLFALHFSVGRVSMIASPSEKEVQSFHEVQS